MKKNLVYLLSAITLFFSCSPAYKTSQTPDDVYYSPAKKVYAEDQYQSYTSSSDEDYLRMKVKDHDKWSSLDDYDYWYDSRYYNNNYYYNPYAPGVSVSFGIGFGIYPYYPYYPYYAYSPYWYNPWYSWYSPYYTVVYYKNPAIYYKPLRNNSNLSSYNNRAYNNYNMPMKSGAERSSYYNNSNLRTNNSYYNSQRQNNYNSNPVRTFNSGGGSMSSGGSRISGGGSRSRP